MRTWRTQPGEREWVELLAKGMCELYSPSGEERAVAEYLCERMNEAGLEAGVDDVGNAIGYVKRGAGPTLLLLGHIDTVAGFIPVRVENGFLYGRGAVDAKGAMAALIGGVVRCLEEIAGTVIVVGAVEEEAASSRGARAVAKRFRPDYCIVGEPSGWESITLGYKGRLVIRGVFRRPVGHMSGRRASASELAVEFWNRVAETFRNYNNSHTGFERVECGLRSVNSWSNGFTEEAEVNIGLRLPLGLAVGEAKSLVLGLSGEGEVEFLGEEPAFKAGKENVLVASMLRSIRSAGGTPSFKVKTGTSDMNVVGPVWKCPIVAYGPGDSKLDHSPEERLSLDELWRSVLVVEGVVRDIAGRRARVEARI